MSHLDNNKANGNGEEKTFNSSKVAGAIVRNRTKAVHVNGTKLGQAANNAAEKFDNVLFNKHTRGNVTAAFEAALIEGFGANNAPAPKV